MSQICDSIQDLEKKYMEKIWEFVSSDEFHKDLVEIEKYINENYEEINEIYQKKNKFDLAAERVITYYVHKKLNVTGIFASPISSDFAFYTDDCLINIDAKTIDLDGNEGDDKYIQFGPHQISFLNNTFFAKKIQKKEFSGITMVPGLRAIDKKTGLPCLTFFIGITYRDDRNSFEISHIKLSCVPNGVVAKEVYKNDLIQNFKTYHYLKVDEARRLGEEYCPKQTSKNSSKEWVPFSMKGGERVDTWLDTSLKHPFCKFDNAIWRVVDKKYHICLGGATARIHPDKIKQRLDSKGEKWLGVRSIKLKR